MVRIRAINTSSRGMAARNTLLSWRLSRMDSTKAATSITGARTSSRMPIIRVICMLFTSLVSRVTNDAVENFSMLEKAKSWMCSYSARRSSAPKPCPAMEERAAPPRPKHREMMAMPAIRAPFRRM